MMNSLPELPFWETGMKREILDQNWMLCLRPLSSFAIPSKLFWVFQLVSLKQWYCLVVICPFPLFYGSPPPPITIKKPHNYYSQSCPLLGSVCEFNFFLSLYIWELHSLQHPASLYMFLSVFHSHSWNRRINLGSDVPLFSFKKNHTSTAENMNLKRKCRSHFLYFVYPWKRESGSQSEAVQYIYLI